MQEYRGYFIEYNIYNKKEYSVQFCGDDYIFTTPEAAKAFIDSINGGKDYDR